MPHWLSDPQTPTFITLFLFVLVAGGIWLRSRKRGALITFALAVVLLLGLFLCDFLVESPREESVRKVNAMSTAFTNKSWGDFSKHLATNFEYKGMTKESLKSKFEWGTAFGARVAVWNFEREQVRYTKDGVEIEFDAKAEANGNAFPLHIKALFIREADGEYRLKTFSTYNIINKQQEQPIPGVP